MNYTDFLKSKVVVAPKSGFAIDRGQLKAHGIVLDKERLNAYIDAAIKEMEQSEVPKLEAVEIPQIETDKAVE